MILGLVEIKNYMKVKKSLPKWKKLWTQLKGKLKMEMLDDREYLTPPDNEAIKVYEYYFYDNPICEEKNVILLII